MASLRQQDKGWDWGIDLEIIWVDCPTCDAKETARFEDEL